MTKDDVKLREAFEAKAVENGFVMLRSGDGYFNDCLQWCWMFWQAALTHEREHGERLAGALFGLRYSHGCWCDEMITGDKPHSRCCDRAREALTAHEARKGEYYESVRN